MTDDLGDGMITCHNSTMTFSDASSLSGLLMLVGMDVFSATEDDAAEISRIIAHAMAGLYSGRGARHAANHHLDGTDSTRADSVQISPICVACYSRIR